MLDAKEYLQRERIYVNAFIHYGEKRQMLKALEELAECQQALCKFLSGEDTADHVAEEIADARIMLEQMCLFLGVGKEADEYLRKKIERLNNRLMPNEKERLLF